MTVELPDKKGILLDESEYSNSFVEAVVVVFSELRDELLEDEGIHMRMSATARATEEAISRGEFDRVEAIFSLIAKALDEGIPIAEFENAVMISFLSPACPVAFAPF